MPLRHIPTLPISPIHAFDANVRFRAEAMIDRTASMGALPPVGLPALRLVSGRADQRLSDVVGSISAVRPWHERQSIIDHLGPLANSKSTFFQATKHIHCTSLGEPFALQQTQSNRDSPFFERKNRRRSHMPGEGDGRGGEGGSASGANAGLVAEGGEGASGAGVAAGMGPGTSVACAAGRLPCK